MLSNTYFHYKLVGIDLGDRKFGQTFFKIPRVTHAKIMITEQIFTDTKESVFNKTSYPKA